MKRTWRAWAWLVGAATILVGGCTPTTPGAGASPSPVAVTASGTLTEAERQFGSSPVEDPRVTYQSDVVLVRSGARSVRSVSSDGLLWTMDGSDPDVRRLAVGQVMLATSFGTGRVAALGRDGSDIQVVLTPVALTDVVADADIAADEPLPLDSPLFYTTPDRPGLVAGGNPGADGTTAAPAVYVQRASAGTAAVLPGGADPVSVPWPVHSSMLPPVAQPTAVAAGDFTAIPNCCGKHTGLTLAYEKNGARLALTLGLDVSRPTVRFHLSIAGGTVRDASVRLDGASAVSLDLQAATTSSRANFTSPAIEVPTSITLPLFGTPIPLTATLTQAFDVSLQLGGAASLSTHGSIGLTGGLGFTYTGGSPKVDASAFAVTDSLLSHIEHRAVASSAVVAHWGLRIAVGIGVHGFMAGVWYQLTTGVGLVADGMASGDIAPCVDGSARISGSYGVGYSIPKVVAQVVNQFLTVVNLAPIAASGGPQWGPSTLWEVVGSQRCHLRAP